MSQRISLSSSLALCLLMGLGVPLQAQITGNGYALMMREVFSFSCLNCHDSAKPINSRNGAPAGVNFDTYTLAYVSATRANTRVQAGTMPPLTGGLDAARKAVFQTWVDAGVPLGEIVVFPQLQAEVLEHSCMGCHSVSKSGSDRNGAPADANFDTYELFLGLAVRANSAVQEGGMPPGFSGITLSAEQKAMFQDWVNLDLPSGRRILFPALNDSVYKSKCNSCHDSKKSGVDRRGAPTSINFDTYASAKASFAVGNNLIQAGTHPSSSVGITAAQKKLSFDWIYSGTPDTDTRPACDVDGDGTAGVRDLVRLLLRVRDNSFDPAFDFNGDGSLSLGDALTLLVLERKGGCRESGPALAGVPEARVAGLSAEQLAWLESVRDRLGLSAEEAVDYSLALYGAAPAGALPRAFSLSQNSPNPFNPATTISYTVPEGQASVRVRIDIFDSAGHLVRTLVDTERAPGTHSVFWDGLGREGRPAASGVYFYRLSAGEINLTRKMVLLK
ncbi:T9SS type A sorting domain-containing protein [bacterium]|nr:T9SS type A sorting domain-containing protein [bacterium]